MTSTNTKPLGKIEKVDLREVWPNEAINFTRWLSQEENLSQLGNEIGIDLELIELESSVGSFNADIYAQEIGTGKKIIIENQLEETNHSHLGQIITYASGKEASIVVWLVSKAREEHRNAIDWLNEHTDMEIGFFLIEMELWSIDGSNPALKFNVVEQPNNWAKTVRVSDNLNETDKMRLQYWQEYNEIASNDEEFTRVFRPHSPSTNHWSNLAVGSSMYHIALLIYTDNKIGIEISVPNNKIIGKYFIDNINEFEEKLNLHGEPFDATKGSGIRFFEKGLGIKQNVDKWNDCIKWHMEKAILMKDVLNKLDIPD